MATWTLVAAVIAAVSSTLTIIATVIKAVLSLREKRRKELPQISFFGTGEGGTFNCHLDTDKYSPGWSIRRVDVEQFEYSLTAPMVCTFQDHKSWKCLAQTLPRKEEGEGTTWGDYSEWRDFCEWSKETELYTIAIHDHCGSALLKFTCEMPFRPWWNLWRKQVKVHFVYKKGTRYPMLREHPLLKNLENMHQ